MYKHLHVDTGALFSLSHACPFPPMSVHKTNPKGPVILLSLTSCAWKSMPGFEGPGMIPMEMTKKNAGTHKEERQGERSGLRIRKAGF